MNLSSNANGGAAAPADEARPKYGNTFLFYNYPVVDRAQNI